MVAIYKSTDSATSLGKRFQSLVTRHSFLSLSFSDALNLVAITRTRRHTSTNAVVSNIYMYV